MNLQQISYIGYLGAAFHLTCWSSMRADDLGSIYHKKTFTVTKMKFELFNTLPNRSLALLLAGPDLGDKIYKPGL